MKKVYSIFGGVVCEWGVGSAKCEVGVEGERTYIAVSKVFYERFEAIGHGLGGVWVYDEHAGCHCGGGCGVSRGRRRVLDRYIWLGDAR